MPKPASAWSKDIAHQFGNTIPIISETPKGASQHHFNFQGLCKDFELAQAMAYRSKKFNSTSAVLRASLHVGLHIVYHLTKMGDPEFAEQAGKILHLSSVMEQTFYRADVMDRLIKDVDTMRHCIKLGLLSNEDFEAQLLKLFTEAEESFGSDFAKKLQESVGELKIGKKLSVISSCKTHGGVRQINE